MANHILVVDDDPSICEALERGFRLEGFAVRIATNGEAAIQEIELTEPALLILDINMPQVDGIQVIKYIRSKSIDLPVCVLSARDEIQDRVLGLEAGADDYLIKPFAFEELLARVRALLRRSGVESSKSLTLGELKVDPLTREVTYFDNQLILTRKEFELLYTLAGNPGIVFTREQLLDKVWGYDFEVQTNVVDVFVGYLRKKMEDTGNERLIETVRGVGFVLKR
ncbi:MAG: DNA-binding response regulator [Chloroflexi bacterium]|nr:DNA-binding response regulator [Chloroflexota bacterium]|tara:strand:- start:1026 stop:1700 length:675 start_codon:yes stop_codon:yes gene_type:complete